MVMFSVRGDLQWKLGELNRAFARWHARKGCPSGILRADYPTFDVTASAGYPTRRGVKSRCLGAPDM